MHLSACATYLRVEQESLPFRRRISARKTVGRLVVLPVPRRKNIAVIFINSVLVLLLVSTVAPQDLGAAAAAADEGLSLGDLADLDGLVAEGGAGLEPD